MLVRVVLVVVDLCRSCQVLHVRVSLQDGREGPEGRLGGGGGCGPGKGPDEVHAAVSRRLPQREAPSAHFRLAYHLPAVADAADVLHRASVRGQFPDGPGQHRNRSDLAVHGADDKEDEEEEDEAEEDPEDDGGDAKGFLGPSEGVNDDRGRSGSGVVTADHL